MTASTKLAALTTRWGVHLTSSKIDEPLVRALYWKRIAWDATQVMAGCGYGRDADHVTADYIDATEDFAVARAKYRKIIQDEWHIRTMERFVPSVNASDVFVDAALAECAKPLIGEAVNVAA